MGLFSNRKKKTKEEQVEFSQITVEEALKQRGINETLSAHDEIKKQTKEYCRQIIDGEEQLEEVKKEYKAVTDYLTDIQKIDFIEGKDKKDIEEAAENIIKFEKERKKLQKKEREINEEQYRHMERYENEIQKGLRRLYEQEQYQQIIKEDLKQLEGEKGIANYEKEAALDRRIFLRKLAITSCIVVIMVFVALLILSSSIKADFMVPFFITGVLALSITLYIVLDSRKCIFRFKMSEKKLNKVIVLMNKIKIKYINCTGNLEFAYEKYHVNSYLELSHIWEEYKKAKEEESRLRKNTEQIEFYRCCLIEELEKHGVADAEIWIYEPAALLDNKEMVEVRHRLNGRRQKLREHIDRFSKERDTKKTEFTNFVVRNKSWENEIREQSENCGYPFDEIQF